MNQVTIFSFGYIHLDHYRGRCAFHAHGLEETTEQFVKTGFSPWIVRDDVLHSAFLLNGHAIGRVNLLLTLLGPRKKRNGPVEGRATAERKSKWHRHACCA